MANLPQNTQATSPGSQALHNVLTQQRSALLVNWETRIRETAVLQLREDIKHSAADSVLAEFFDLIIEQITAIQDYALLRQRIFSGEINAVTPDAAGRLLIALKKTVLDHLSNSTTHQQFTPEIIANLETTFDEILLRISEYYHEMRYRNLEQKRSQSLHQRNEEIERLLAAEKRRAAHLATNNRIAQMALSTLDPAEIFRRIVHEVQQSFNYQHVSLYVIDEHQVIMKSRAGVYEEHFPEGYRQDLSAGIVGHTVSSGQPIMANDVANDPRRIIAFPEEKNTQSELCIPIKTGDDVIGALDVLSQKKNGFNQTDVQSLQVLTDQLAWVIHNARLFHETRELKEFNEQILQTIPLPVLLLDKNQRVTFANKAYIVYHELSNQNIVGKPLIDSRPASYLITPQGRKNIDTVFETGEAQHLSSLNIPTNNFQNRVVDLLISRLDTTSDPLVLVVFEDITESIEKAYESSLLRQISQIMQGILDIDRLLYAILTCVTAGTGLGFNRAILLQVNAEKKILEGKIGVGPANHQEASRIWAELANKNPTVDDILANYNNNTSAQSTLSRAAQHIEVDLNDPDDILAQSIRERRTFVVTEEDTLTISPALWAALGTHHFVVTPLVGREKAVGVIVADNLYSSAPITEDSVDLLKAFAGNAALALENASLYNQLQEKIEELERTQDELVQSERLAVIGELSARIAHEIRNPLATIGGFARSLQRAPNTDRVETASRIISLEVTRLEDLLTDILNYTRPRVLSLEPTNLPDLITEVYHQVAEGLEERGISYHQEAPPDMPQIPVDDAQFKQVLINLIKNAFQVMPDGGALTVYIRINPEQDNMIEIELKDTGPGISAEISDQIFKPYFTTKTTGTGLGLAISKQIVERHKGTLSFTSTEGEGTSIFIHLPIRHPQGEPA